MAAAASLPYPSDLRDARYLIAVGRLERVRWYRSLWAFELLGVQGLTADAAARVGQEHRASWEGSCQSRAGWAP